MLPNQSRKRHLFRQWEGAQLHGHEVKFMSWLPARTSQETRQSANPTLMKSIYLPGSLERLISQLPPPSFLLFPPSPNKPPFSSERLQVHFSLAHPSINLFIPPSLHYLLIEKTQFSSTGICLLRTVKKRKLCWWNKERVKNRMKKFLRYKAAIS